MSLEPSARLKGAASVLLVAERHTLSSRELLRVGSAD
jgi:hypothetical protein